MRAYTVTEIDQMRSTLYIAFPNHDILGTRSGLYHSLWVENRLRTYLLASVEPSELEESLMRKDLVRDMTPEEIRTAVAETTGINDLMGDKST